MPLRPPRSEDPPPNVTWDDAPPPPPPLPVPAREHIRTLPTGTTYEPEYSPDYTPTEKQVRFLTTVVACVVAKQTTFPEWRLAHMARVDEKVSNIEWANWNASPAFVRWFTDDITWTPTPSDQAMFETHFQLAMSKKLAEGKDTKAIELHAKITKKIGDQVDQSRGGLTGLLDWAHGKGAADTKAIVVEGKAESIGIEADPWGAARVTPKSK